MLRLVISVLGSVVMLLETALYSLDCDHLDMIMLLPSERGFEEGTELLILPFLQEQESP